MNDVLHWIYTSLKLVWFDSRLPHFKVSFYFFSEPVFVSYLCANELPKQSKKESLLIIYTHWKLSLLMAVKRRKW